MANSIAYTVGTRIRMLVGDVNRLREHKSTGGSLSQITFVNFLRRILDVSPDFADSRGAAGSSRQTGSRLEPYHPRYPASPSTMALRLTGEKTYFASEASVFRLPKADNLIIYPAFLVIMAAKEFFVDHYNHGRDRKNLDNLTPSDVDFGRDKTISPERKRSNGKASNTPPLAASRAGRMI